MKERKKTYLSKDNGPTTPLWAKTHVQKYMATLHDTPISLIMSGLQVHEQSIQKKRTELILFIQSELSKPSRLQLKVN